MRPKENPKFFHLLGILSPSFYTPYSSLQPSILRPRGTSPPPWWPQWPSMVTSLSGHPTLAPSPQGPALCGLHAGPAGSEDSSSPVFLPHKPQAAMVCWPFLIPIILVWTERYKTFQLTPRFLKFLVIPPTKVKRDS